MKVTDADHAFDFEDAYRRERRDDARAARVFERVCRESAVDDLMPAVELLDLTIDGWRLAMRRVCRLSGIPQPEFRHAFLNIWIQRKTLPRKVGHRPTLAAALRVLMPRNYNGAPLRLYRGAMASERQRRLYGFSWTTDRATAETFAEDWRARKQDAVVLETLAPAEAIFVLRQDEDFYDEREAVVDPFRLGKVNFA